MVLKEVRSDLRKGKPLEDRKEELGVRSMGIKVAPGREQKSDYKYEFFSKNSN